MEIFLDKRAVRQIRLSAQDAIEEGDTETLREDILEAFTEEQVEEIERRLDQNKRLQTTISTVANRHRDAGVDKLCDLLTKD